MPTATQERVIDALRAVKPAAMERDIVDLDLVRDVTVAGDTVSVTLDSLSPGLEARRMLEEKTRQAVTRIGGIQQVNVKIGWRVPAGQSDEGRQSVPGISNIVAVSSGKGGVGKSTIAVNLAIALGSYGAKVGLLDTDVYGPNVPIMVGVNEEPKVVGQRLIPNQAYGIKVMSLGFLNRGDRPTVWRGPMLHTAVRQFLYDVEWGELDYLIVDMPPGTGDAQLSLAQLVPVQGAVLVTTPQEVALGDVRKAFNMFQQVKIPVLGVVENMSYFICDNCSTRHEIFGSGGGQELVRRFESFLLGRVPLSIGVREGGDRGVPTVIGNPDSAEAEAFREIADKVASRLSVLALTASGLPSIDMGDSRGDRFAV
jgi:ATP-binding protein involved in chromosome partitioning